MLTIRSSPKKTGKNAVKGFIVIGSDHAGLNLKEKVKEFLISMRINIVDVGTYDKNPVDYPDIAKKVADIVKKKKDSKGILICGSGTGMCIAANRIKGIRAVAAYDDYSARMSRHDNDANVLCLRGRNAKYKDEIRIISVWLKSEFSGIRRHQRRIKKLDMVKL